MDMNEPSVLYWIPIALLCYAIKVLIDVFKWTKELTMLRELFFFVLPSLFIFLFVGSILLDLFD